MIAIRKASERGHLDYGWLKANYTFSFASYFDPAHMGFRSLRVMNNDTIDGGKGFDTHPHKDMEIITFILEGALEHRDTLGNHSIIKPGEIQIMSAGTGVYHSEFNPLDKDTKLYQIWIKPNKLGVEPRYEQYSYLDRLKKNEFIDLVTSNGAEKVAKVYQDAAIRLGHFEAGYSHELQANPANGHWLQVISGELEVNGHLLKTADGVALEDVSKIELNYLSNSEVLHFELA